MHLTNHQGSCAPGNILLAAVCTVGLICLALIAVLELASHRVRMLSRSEAWNSCLPAAEAGIDEALVHCNRDTNLATGSWSLSNGLYMLQTVVGEAQVSTAVRQITDTNVEITATATCRLPAGGGVVSRTVRITARREHVFLGGLIVEDGVELKGNNLLSDSYDSRDPNKSTNGWYDVSKRGDKGDIYCTAGTLNSLNVGTADVYGRVETSPQGSVLIKNTGSVGDLAWHAANNFGIEPGASSSDLNVSLPDVTAPFTSAAQPRPATPADAKVINDTTNQTIVEPLVGRPRNRTTTVTYVDPITGIKTNIVTTVIADPSARTLTTTISTTITYTESYNSVLDGGDYATGTLGGQLLVRGNSRIYVWDLIQFTGSDFIRLDNGASLTIYNAGEKAVIGQILSTNSSPQQFQYFGLNSNTYIELKNSPMWAGLIYAPNAYLKMAGLTAIYGSVAVRSAELSGNASFHFDESARFWGPYLAYVITSWEEL